MVVKQKSTQQKCESSKGEFYSLCSLSFVFTISSMGFQTRILYYTFFFIKLFILQINYFKNKKEVNSKHFLIKANLI